MRDTLEQWPREQRRGEKAIEGRDGMGEERAKEGEGTHVKYEWAQVTAQEGVGERQERG